MAGVAFWTRIHGFRCRNLNSCEMITGIGFDVSEVLVEALRPTDSLAGIVDDPI